MIKHWLTTVAVLLTIVPSCFGQIKTEPNIAYGEAGGQKLLLDVIRQPEPSKKPRPALILVHGGAWSAGDKGDFRDAAQSLAGQGYVVFSINYRLVTPTGNKWPAQLDDAQRAVRWVRANAVRYGVDAQKVAALGGSAGGHIVACLATSDTRDNSDPALAFYSSRVQCAIDISGPTDLTVDMAPTIKQGTWTNQQIRNLLGGKLEQFGELARAASPLFHVDAKTCPVLIVHGQKDEIVPVDQAQRFADVLTKAGVPNKLLIFENEGHGVDHADNLLKLMLASSAFLQKYLPF